jgi:hypothetical protein
VGAGFRYSITSEGCNYHLGAAPHPRHIFGMQRSVSSPSRVCVWVWVWGGGGVRVSGHPRSDECTQEPQLYNGSAIVECERTPLPRVL